MSHHLISSGAKFLPCHSRSISEFQRHFQFSVRLLSASARKCSVQSRLYRPVFEPHSHARSYSRHRVAMNGHGDLNNQHVLRETITLEPDTAYRHVSLAIPTNEDNPEVRERYRPFLLNDAHAADDWIASLELSTTLKIVESEILEKKQDRLRIIVLYGSLRSR